MFFRYKRLIMSLFILIVIGFTALLAGVLGPDTWETEFWYKMIGIWLCEALLGIAIMAVATDSGRTLPFQPGNVAVASAHLVYALLLLLLPVSAIAIVLWEVGGLIVAVILHTIFGFAQHAVIEDDIKAKKVFSLRNEMLAALEMLEVSRRETIAGDPELAKAFAKLKDDAGFASDSVPGCEAADEDIRAGLAALRQCADAAELTRAAVDLAARLQVRQNIVKRSR